MIYLYLICVLYGVRYDLYMGWLGMEQVFSRELTEEPAAVQPMDLVVDDTKWQNKRNKLPPRIYSLLKNKEIERQVEMKLQWGIIRRFQAPYYSQIHIILNCMNILENNQIQNY